MRFGVDSGGRTFASLGGGLWGRDRRMPKPLRVVLHENQNQDRKEQTNYSWSIHGIPAMLTVGQLLKGLLAAANNPVWSLLSSAKP